ncbi:MAG: OmpA family protein [Lysobacteraceae bacterium]
MKPISTNLKKLLGIGLLGASMLLAGGCSNYVKRADLDAALADLRARDSAIEAKADANTAALASLRQELSERFAQYDKAISEARGKVRVDAMAHFDYDSSTLREEDKAALEDFARVIRDHHPGSLITVEGFTDPAGSVGYNQRLGQARADAVREHLVANGLPADTVRAVSYGKASNRLVAPGNWGDSGLPNRRASLVVDRAGS